MKAEALPAELPARDGATMRVATRLLGFATIIGWAAIEVIAINFLTRGDERRRARAAWLQRTSRKLLRLLHVRANFSGETPANGLLVCNHLSYLDIIVLAARQPLAFVAKKEVRSWPVIGWLAACGGTLFIDREARRDVARVGNEIGAALKSGAVVCIFPEGTSSDGADVLPFRPSLLQPAIENQCAVTPARIRYTLAEGSVADEVCYWRDMTFGPHFVHLAGIPEINAHVACAPQIRKLADRKQLAISLRETIRNLRVSA